MGNTKVVLRSGLNLGFSLNYFNMWKNNNFRLIQVFYYNFPMKSFRYVSAFYQVMFNTDEQSLFCNFIMIFRRK